jgi:Flp pilus assembly protein TadD
LFRKRQFKTALVDFNDLLTKNPESARAYNQRGLIKAGLGDNTGALLDFNDAIALKNNDFSF